MPPLISMLMKHNARQRLQQFKLTLPTAALSSTSDPAAILSGAANVPQSGPAPRPGPGWQVAPRGARPVGAPIMGGHRAQTGIPTPVPPGLFVAASNNKKDVDFQAAVNAEYDGFLDRMCDAIVRGFDMWRQGARFANVVINGPLAVGGSVEGAPLNAFIKAVAPRTGLFGKAAALSDALADAIGNGWQMVTSAITVNGQTWYPTFAAFPGPMAPPTPNLPTPLSALGVPLQLMSVTLLKPKAMQHLSGTKPFAAEEVIAAILAAVEGELRTWVHAQLVTNVLGTGPVVSFAPPNVVVGPVVGGHVLPTPGAFAS